MENESMELLENENTSGVETEENEKEVADDTVKQYIVVNLGDEFFGIDIMNIDNIVRMQRITRVPKSLDYF